MRTRKSVETFRNAFVLTRETGELPPGRYNIEIDEEEIGTADRISYRRTAIYVVVQQGTSTRTIAVTPSEFDLAVERDQDSSGI